jgi:hypothetical protein
VITKPPGRKRQASIAGDNDAPPQTLAIAERVGKLLAERGYVLVSGGRGGVMEAAFRGAMSAGGMTIGILPGPDAATANPWCTVVLPSNLGAARNVLVGLSGDLMVALGSSAGTLSEVCFAWVHGRPIYTIAGHSAFLDRLEGKPLDGRATSQIVVCKDVDELATRISQL